MHEFAVILPAAGASSRFGSSRNKLLEALDGVPVIVHSIGAFLNREDVRQIIVACSDADGLKKIFGKFNVPLDGRVRLCPGGTCRAQSVAAALAVADATLEWVAVHDAARPLVTQALIDATLSAAARHGAAVPALAAELTIKQASGPLPALVQRTLPRNQLWSMQTPQAMRRKDLAAAFDACPIPLDEVTDDAQLLELIGKPVWLIPGETKNIKITTPADLRLAEVLIRG
jgi:2-C-methyl-D-erythritol 4-phosphate cytidylyltransferase